MIENYPNNPSSDEILRLTKEADAISKDRREEQKRQETMRFAKRLGALTLVVALAPFAAHKIDRAIAQPQEQSTKNAEKIINANPAVANTLDTFKTNDGQTVTVKTK
jgi:hypothetical protein